MHPFETIDRAPEDSIFGLIAEYNRDSREKKINLTVGVYMDESLQITCLEAVLQAELMIAQNRENKNYQAISGNPLFCAAIGQLAFGKTIWKKIEESTYCAQMIGGTGAIRQCAELLADFVKTPIYISDPSWVNHRQICERVGLEVREYPYYDRTAYCLNFKGMLATLEQAPPYSSVILHVSCHNPTGVDLSHEQWRELSQLMKRKQLIPVFDFAYQGFGDGVEEDAYAPRLFAQEGHDFFVAYSCSKAFTMYGERVGALFFVSHSGDLAKRVGSQVNRRIRSNYSNPPKIGAKIVETIFASDSLTAMWKGEINVMRLRISQMREALVRELASAGNAFDFSFLQSRKGLFCFTGLDETMVRNMRDHYGIFMTKDGRINLAGINTKNVARIAQALYSEKVRGL